MLEHPGIELQVLIKEKGLTQKAFSSILGKKVSEVNELLKGKRNITIQRDYLLHQTLGTPIKYWILKQIDYDYSLLDIEEQKNSPSVDGDTPEELGGFSNQTNHSEQSEIYSDNGKSASNQTHDSGPETHENTSNTTPLDSSLLSKGQTDTQDSYPVNEVSSQISQNNDTTQNKTNAEETSTKEPDSKNDEDLKNRAKIFRTF